MPFLLDQAADLFNPAIQKMFLKSSELDEGSYKEYVNVTTGVTDYNLIDSSLTGIGEASFIPENGVIVEETPVQGFDRTYQQEFYGKTLAFTKAQWKFGIKKRDMQRITSELRMACVRKRDRNFADILNNFTATTFSQTNDTGTRTVTITGGDGVAFGSASHTREDSGTNWGNLVTDGTTTNMDFEYDALKAAGRTASLIRDGKGNLMDFSPDVFFFRRGVAIANRAMEINGALRSGKIPGGNENDGAGVPAFKVVELPYITQNAYWFGLDSRFKNDVYGLQYFESMPITLGPVNVVYKTKELQYTVEHDYAWGFNDSRPWVCSTGANA